MTPFRETPSLCLPISHRFQKLFHQRCDSQLTGETADSVLVLAGADSGQDLFFYIKKKKKTFRERLVLLYSIAV